MTASLSLIVTTGSASRDQGLFARDALRSQRSRLSGLFNEFDSEAWTAPTRCPEWSVHQVVGHLCDVTVRWHALLGGERLESVGLGEGFDPRTTPADWVERSAAGRPAETLRVFEQTSAEVLDDVDRLAESGAVDEVSFPYGVVPWSIVALHLFWDAWVHERDVAVPLGRPQASTEIESRAAAAYALVMSGVPYALVGGHFSETVVLDGAGGGLFQLDVRDGTVTVRIDRDSDGGGALGGSLPEVVDALIGRDPDLVEVLHGPTDRVHALGRMRRYMMTSAG